MQTQRSMLNLDTATRAPAETPRQQARRHASASVIPKVPLSHREFAREYVVMPPNGPRGGERYRDEWQPVIGLLWDEFDKCYWKEAAITGPVQASKSFGALVIPTLRDVIELRYEPIVGVPEADMFADKWDKDFRPVLEASERLRHLLPDKGSGSKGGRAKDRVSLRNGVDIKVMSRGGAATNKAGYTSPRLRITEAAGFSHGSTSERDEEADAYRQLLGRLGAFGLKDPRRFVAIEGTGTIDEQLPWRLRGKSEDDVVISSMSRIVSQCPHCAAWISPEREHLVGWQEAESMMQVMEEASFCCPECGQIITDEERRKSVADCKLVHYGQEITPDGTITGPLPPTLRLWFRWSAWHNLLLDAADTAVKEWEAAQIEEGTQDREDAERDLCQKSWAIPYKSRLVENEQLDAKVVRKRRSTWQRGLLPADTLFYTIGGDMGDWTGWWFALAFRACGELLVPAYGAFDVKRDKSDDLSTRIVHSLREFRETVVLSGFPVEGKDTNMLPGAVGIDIGYMPDDIAEALREFGGLESIFVGCRGRGKSVNQQGGANNGGYHHPRMISNAVPILGTQWYAEWNYKRRLLERTFNADYWKLWIQERLRIKPGCKGALSLYRADSKNEHAKLSNHLASEQLTKAWDPKRGLIEKWVKSGENHWLDCAAIASFLGDSLGFKLTQIVGSPPTEDVIDDDTPETNWCQELLACG